MPLFKSIHNSNDGFSAFLGKYRNSDSISAKEALLAVKNKVVSKKETPLMKQYNAIKAKHPDALLLFRVGDFYETFGEDAVKAASVLGIVLTKRHNGAAGEIELAGFPHHSLDSYLPKLVRSGLRVAVCDQLENPKMTKTIVKRGVTELVTPGVTFNDDVLDKKANNFLASLHFEKDQLGLALLDVSTGEFLTGQGSPEYIDKLVQNFRPSEIIYQKQKAKQYHEFTDDQFYSFAMGDWAYAKGHGEDLLNRHFGTAGLKGFGLEELPLGVVAAGVVMEYLSVTQHDRLKHITGIKRIDERSSVWLDKFTIRNLELIHSPHNDGSTLIDVMDRCSSPMGSRTMRRWMIFPLKEVKPLQQRLNIVKVLIENEGLAEDLNTQLSQIGDLERLVSKAAVGKVNPRELCYLREALASIESIKHTLKGKKHVGLNELDKRLDSCVKLRQRLESELQHDAPVAVHKGNVIAEGVNAELDEYRKLQREGKNYLLDLQKRETENTGITSLKVAYNNVFGYYIEVRNTHRDKVPADWIRKQTLVSAERYITEELKTYESKILGAEEKILELETGLFQALVESVIPHIASLQLTAFSIGELDCLLSFAKIATANSYVQPKIDDSLLIDIKDGRHPVIEHHLPIGETYVTNDVFVDPDSQQILMITGPNMSGKSALLRQTALITLMAQMGSFVPARHAHIGIVDKIFTRVGASDNISKGESTFMVEMNETASILNNISDRSLILLDEIGRGTSTYDGISIAWSIAEFLHENGSAKPKTLFATHYHELNDMCNQFKRIRNFHVAVKELEDRVIFLRKFVPGGTEHSFGIHVAKMAGMPNSLIKRANEVLKSLESAHGGKDVVHKSADDEYQLSFFQLDDPVLEQIRDELTRIDINSLTPVEALFKLNEIKNLVGGKNK